MDIVFDRCVKYDLQVLLGDVGTCGVYFSWEDRWGNCFAWTSYKSLLCSNVLINYVDSGELLKTKWMRWIFFELSAKPFMPGANFFKCLAVITLKRGKKEDFAVSLLENPCLLSMLLGKWIHSFGGPSAANLTFLFLFLAIAFILL